MARRPCVHEDWTVEDALAAGWWYGTRDPLHREEGLREAYRVARGIQAGRVMSGRNNPGYDFWRHIETFGYRPDSLLTASS